MSQKDPKRDPAPIVHRYDPKQAVAIPTAVIPASRPATPVATVPSAPAADPAQRAAEPEPAPSRPVEIGGPSGPEPTRYGDWERNGRVSDF